MKVFLFFAVLIVGFTLAITAAVKPEAIEQHYKSLTAPIEKHLSARKASLLREAKEEEFANWMMKLKLPADCTSTKSAVRELECRNLRQLHTRAFEQAWTAKVDSGWEP